MSDPTDTNDEQGEGFCDQCGRWNPVWGVDSDRFNAAMGGPDGIVCPSCFIKFHEIATGLTCVWKLIPDGPFRHVDADGVFNPSAAMKEKRIT